MTAISDIRMSHSRQKWLGGTAALPKLLCLRCSLPSCLGLEYCQKEAFCCAVVECALVSVFWFSRLPNMFVPKNPASLLVAATGCMLSIDSFSFTSLLDSVRTRSPRARLVGSFGSCSEQLAQSSKVMRLEVLLSLAKERLGLEQVLGQSWRESLSGRAVGVGVEAGGGAVLPSRYLMMASFSAMALVRWQILLLSSSCFISQRLRQRWHCSLPTRSWQFSACSAAIACSFSSSSRSHSSRRTYFSPTSRALASTLPMIHESDSLSRARYCSSCSRSLGGGGAGRARRAGTRRDSFKFMVTDYCYKQQANNFYAQYWIRMGACEQHCLKEEEQEDEGMIVLPKSSLSSIRWQQKESLSTDDSQEDSWESPEDSEHLCTASRFFRTGDYQRSINEFMLALHAICKDSSVFAQVHTRIARSYLHLKRHSLAAQHCRVALDNAQERGFREEAAASAELMGEIKLAEQDCTLAVFYFEKALRGWEELGEEGKCMELKYSLGIIHMELHNHDKVLQFFEALLSPEIEHDSSNSGPFFKIHLYLARIYSLRCRYKEGIRCFGRCLQIALRRSEEYRETVFEFRQMAARMRETCSFEELLRLQALVSSTGSLKRLAES